MNGKKRFIAAASAFMAVLLISAALYAVFLSRRFEHENIQTFSQYSDSSSLTDRPPITDEDYTDADIFALPFYSDVIININTATYHELMLFDCINASLAYAIINYREKYGDFVSIEEIKAVKGIGVKTFERIKDNITV